MNHALVPIACALLVGTLHAQFAPPLFEASAYVFDEPDRVAFGDFDGDCRVDMVVTDAAANDAIVVLRGDGSGSFAFDAIYLTPNNPTPIEVGDMNGDGHDDVVYSTTNSGQVFVRLGDGTGVLGAATVAAGIDTCRQLALGDLNGDADLDVVMATSSGTYVLLGDGTGGLGAVTTIDPVDNAWSVEVADFNADSFADILVARDGEALVLWGDGSGTSYTPQVIAATGLAWAARTVDMNGDGDLDIAVTRQTSTDVLIVENLGGSTLVTNTSLSVPAFIVQPVIAVGDVDGDGRSDIIVSGKYFGGPTGGEMFVALGNGTRFGAFESFDCDGGVEMIVVRDLNGDGRDDVTIVDNSQERVVVFEAGGVQGTIASSAVSMIPTPSLDHVQHVVLPDGDAHLDLVATSGSNVVVLAGDGAGGFTLAATYPGSSARDLRILDVNHDLLLDVVTVDFSNTITVLLGDATGGFGSPAVTPIASGTLGVTTGDIDGDGFDDVLVRGSQAVTRLLSSASGLTPPTSFSTAPVSAFGAIIAEITGDAFADVVLTSSDSVSVMPGDGVGGFGASQAVSVTPPLGQVERAAAVDLDGDSKTDLVLVKSVGAFASQVIATLADGSGGFDVSVTHDLPAKPPFLHVAGIDGAGELDIVAVSPNDALLAVLRGDDVDQLSEPEIFALPLIISAGGATPCDVDGDGDLDIAWVSDFISPVVGVVRNTPALPGPWTDLGNALPALNDPFVFGRGALVDDTPVSLCLEGARPGAMSTLLVGIAAIFAPFKGGVMVPSPDVLFGPFVVDVDGRLRFDAIWPQGLPPSTYFAFQHWYDDPNGPKNLAASNGISGVTP